MAKFIFVQPLLSCSESNLTPKCLVAKDFDEMPVGWVPYAVGLGRIAFSYLLGDRFLKPLPLKSSVYLLAELCYMHMVHHSVFNKV